MSLHRLFAVSCATVVLAVPGVNVLLGQTVPVDPDLRIVNAAMQDDKGTVASLLKQKVDVTVASGDGMTALHWAAFKNDLALAQMLLKAGAPLNTKTRVEALTPLFIAASNGNAPIVAELLKAGAEVDLANELGTTPLIVAAGTGSVETVKLLLGKGANPSAKEKSHGQSALMFAAALDRDEVIRVLAKAGADLSATSVAVKMEKTRFDEDGNPLPASAGGGRQTAPGQASVQFMGGLSPLHFAAREGRMKAVQALVESGANVNLANPGDKTTPIVTALINGHYDLAMYLLDKGADPNLAAIDGLAALYAVIDCQWAPVAWEPTPITVQEKNTYIDVMKALIAKGADVNARLTNALWFRPPDHNQMWIRYTGTTPFWRAAQATDLEAMKLLVEHGADPKIASAMGDSALHMAAGVGWAGNFSTNAPGGFMSSVKYLVEEAKLDINTADNQGYTPVMGAAYRGDNEMVQYLVDHGAKLNTRTSRGWSVTDMANGPSLRSSVPLSHPDTIELLVKLGALPLTKVEGEEILGIIKRKVNQTTPDTKPQSDPKKQQ